MQKKIEILNEELAAFVQDGSMEWETVALGLKRKIMGYDGRIMLIKVAFETGGIGVLHQHHHSQISYVESGVFEVEIDGVKKIIKGGDVFYVAPNLIHGAICKEDGMLIDVFSPMREDLIATNIDVA